MVGFVFMIGIIINNLADNVCMNIDGIVTKRHDDNPVSCIS